MSEKTKILENIAEKLGISINQLLENYDGDEDLIIDLYESGELKLLNE